jgi:uncharacterized protein YqeY
VTIKVQLQEDMKAAMRAHEKERLQVIRLMLAAIKQIEVDTRTEVDDEKTLSILDKMLKQRRDSIQQYEQGNRQDLADQEKYEINIIQAYMPKPLSDTEINELINEAVKTSGAKSIQEMGKVMTLLKSQMQGRADMSLVSSKIKQCLS